MKKRLRKKRRLGEFQELGFEVTFECDEAHTEELLGAFIDGAIEANGLVAGGGGAELLDFFVTSARRRGSANETQREVVASWMPADPRVLKSAVGPLWDALVLSFLYCKIRLKTVILSMFQRRTGDALSR